MSVLQLDTETQEQFEQSTGELWPVAPEGQYDARIQSVVDKTSGENSKHPGTPMWEITFALETGDEHDGMRVKTFQVLPAGPGTEWMDAAERKRRVNELKRLWNASGLDIPSDGNLDSDDLHQAQLSVIVGVEEYKGKDQNTVKDILPI